MLATAVIGANAHATSAAGLSERLPALSKISENEGRLIEGKAQRAPFTMAKAGTQAPTLAALLQSMQFRHPYSRAIKEGGVQAQADIDIAQSAFDPYVEQDSFSRVSGYYDGTSLQQRVIKPLENYNALLFSQYRITDGDFPVYEQEYETLSGGEASVGIAFSLLKGKDIDKRRVGIKNARLQAELWQVDATILLNEFIYKGVSNYLIWYESALQVQAIQSLLENAAQREQAISTRVEKGDMAEIELTEFKANMLQQKLLLEKLKQKRDGYSRAVSYYWRNAKGEVIDLANIRTMPSDIEWPFWVGEAQIHTLKKRIAVHPVLSSMRIEQAQNENKIALAKNTLLPKLDIKASIARDIGAGAASLDQTEGKLGLSFSYPLGNRKAKAQVVKVQSKQREIADKLTATQEQIVQLFEQAYTYWKQAKNIALLQQQNASLARELSLMEQKRFDAGDSDMFVLNARASAEIKAQMKEIEAQVDLLKAELALYKVAAALTISDYQ
jgi:outer membrane protein TolC